MGIFLKRLRAEPLVHFFVLGALLFTLHRAVIGDPRTIVVTPGLKAELGRRFEDLRGRAPSAAELDAELRQWERDEAVFREALRQGLDRDEPAIRGALVAKMRAIAAAEASGATERAPTEDELQRWLASHRALYEMPARYDFEFVAFPRTTADAGAERERFERALHDGAAPATLGRPVLGGNMSLPDMQGRVAPELVERLPSFPLGEWQRVDAQHELLLARVKRLDGGLPSLDELRPRLVADWTQAAQQEAVERVLQRSVDRYHIEERSGERP
ncbi:MAG TPA: peptidylprolyl isomerase [Polyangiaceae bacterium]|nr:peptidylprolyl isomerase [Polyangiaceae bacterium]